MRHICIILTREGRLRIKRLPLEHGLLHDKAEKKSYAVIRDAYPTDQRGGWSRAYLVHETSAQTVAVDDTSREVQGGTVELREPLSMVARIRMPGPRGDDGQVRDVHLTAEAIYDRTMSAQVRRLGNRRFQWFHALLFVALGVAMGVFVAGAIALLGGGGGSPEPNDAVMVPAEGMPAQEPRREATVLLDGQARSARPRGLVGRIIRSDLAGGPWTASSRADYSPPARLSRTPCRVRGAVATIRSRAARARGRGEGRDQGLDAPVLSASRRGPPPQGA